MLSLVQHCLAHDGKGGGTGSDTGADTDPGFCFNGQADLQAQAARKASCERARGVPEAFLPNDIKA